jgi:uncharacterized damage-inducible protein DinB
MIYYGAKDLASSFRIVRNNTLTIAEEIPEEQYGYRVAPDCRSVAETLVHIAVSVRLQQEVHFVRHLSTLVGLDFFALFGGMIAEEKTPRTKAEIVALLRSEGEKYATQLEACTDEFLAEPVAYPEGMTPPVKSRFEMLMSPKEHEMHHRGQLMVAQRLLGITPHLTRQMMARVAAAQAGKQ